MFKIKLIYFLMFLCFTTCKKDIPAFIFHSSTETRVKESLLNASRAPEPISLDTTDFNFAVFSDIHITEENIHFLNQIREDATRFDIDFCIVPGDLTENGLKLEYSNSQRALWEIGIPYYTTIGNHDLYQRDGWNSWLDYYGPSVYSIRISNFLQIIFLDTASGLVGKTQIEWLEEELKNSLQKTIVVSHYPIYNGKSPSIWRLSSAEERYKLMSLLRDYNVLAYMSGHYHTFEHYDLAGMNHFIVGSMYPESLDGGTRGYLLCSFENGHFDWKKIEVE